MFLSYSVCVTIVLCAVPITFVHGMGAVLNVLVMYMLGLDTTDSE